jgi:hypothetical protein
LIRETGELRQYSRELSSAFRDSYRSTPQYGELQAETRDVIAHASHLQSLVRAGANFDKLYSEAQSLSQCYRLLVQKVRAADASFGVGYPGPAWRHRHVPSRNPEVQRLLARMDHSLQEISDEFARVRRPSNYHDHHPHQPSLYGQSGLVFSNGRLTVQIGK